MGSVRRGEAVLKKRGWTTVKGSPRSRQDGDVVWIQVVVAARRLGVTRGRVYHLMEDGRLRSKKMDGLLYVREADVELYRVLQRESSRARTVAVG